MRKEDRIRTKAKVNEIKEKPPQQISADETDYCIRKQHIIPDIEENE